MNAFSEVSWLNVWRVPGDVSCASPSSAEDVQCDDKQLRIQPTGTHELILHEPQQHLHTLGNGPAWMGERERVQGTEAPVSTRWAGAGRRHDSRGSRSTSAV